MPKFLPGNTAAQKGEDKRLPWYGTISPDTLKTIHELAKLLKCSQSEVIDRAVSKFHEYIDNN